MLNQQYLEAIRQKEISEILPLIKPGCTVLEIGAGAGWQAKYFADAGYQVSAIDVSGNYYGFEKQWDVAEYDGIHIPFPDAYFDVVFSSNVLEHIAHVENFQIEIMRVLKPDGIAIHILPTGIWRLWTNLTYYPFLWNELLRRMFLTSSDEVMKASSKPNHSCLNKVIRLFIAPRHGETGNALSEIYTFSRMRWSRLFRATGWRVIGYYHNDLFYTGYSIFGEKLPLSMRRHLSTLLGSVCHVFVLQKIKK